MKFSIIIPVYNVAPYLREHLDSLLAQNIPAGEYEIIAVNDGSTDNSPAILSEYEAAHPGRFTIIDQPNGGLGVARNTGFAAARGDYVWMADSDDVILPNCLAAIHKTLVETGAEVLHFPYKGFTKLSEIKTGWRTITELDATPVLTRAALCAFTPCTWDKIFSREFLLRAGFHIPSLWMHEDVADIYRVLSLTRRENGIFHTNRTLYYYRRRPGSMTDSQVYSERRMEGYVTAIRMLADQMRASGDLRNEYEWCMFNQAEDLVIQFENLLESGKCDDESRDAIAKHLPTLIQLMKLPDPGNPLLQSLRLWKLETEAWYKYEIGAWVAHASKETRRHYENSLSWRVTAPLRFMADLFRGVDKRRPDMLE